MPPTLMHGDCLDLMDQIPGSAVDLICADLPYGSTQCGWDKRLPIDRMWSEFKRVLTPTGVVALTADMRFAVELIGGNPKWFRYDLVWRKSMCAGIFDAKRKPLRKHELILMFSPAGRPTYNPQMGRGEPYRTYGASDGDGGCYGKAKYHDSVSDGERYPTSVIEVRSISNSGRSAQLAAKIGKHSGAKVHPTQKPVPLMDWLIRTYSNPGDLVLDPTMGSGTTGVSAIANGRRFIGIEADATHFATAQRRIGEVTPLLEACL